MGKNPMASTMILAALAFAVIRPTSGTAPTFTNAMISTSSSCNAGNNAKYCLVSGTINVDASTEVRVKALASGTTAPAAWTDFQPNTETISATGALPPNDPMYASFTGIDAEVDVYVAGKTGNDLTIVKVSGKCDCAPPTLSNVKLGSASCDDSSKQKSCTVEFDLALNAGGMSPGKVYTITQLSSAAAPTSYDDFDAFKNAVPDPRTELKVEATGTGNTIRRIITNGQDSDYSIYVVAKTSGGNISPITKLAACQCPTSIPSLTPTPTPSTPSSGTAPTPTPSTLSSGVDEKEAFPVWGVVLIIIGVMLLGLIPLCPVCLAMLKKKREAKENEGGAKETINGVAVVPTETAP
jgi:hypothetical protein